MSGDASAWVPSPSPQGGVSSDDARKVASDNVLSQDDAQDEARDGHEGEGASHEEVRHVAFQNDARTDGEQEGGGRGIIV